MSETVQRPDEADQETSKLSIVLTGAAYMLGATALWVVLALTTDRTHHLAPVIIAVVPGVIARVSEREVA